MIYNIYHKTEFRYQSMVTYSHNMARLKPRETQYQKLLDFSLEIDAFPFEKSDFVDMFENTNTHILIKNSHHSLTVIGRSRVEIFPELIEAHIQNIRQNSITFKAAKERLKSFVQADVDAKQFIFDSALIPKATEAIKEYALESFKEERDLFEAANEFMGRIYNDFEFVSGFSDVTTPISEIFEAKKGVCQDFAQLAISAIRGIGLPCKYVSGYIETLPPEGEKKLFGADASHAWFSLYIPNAGWIEFDPTNNLLPREQHILLGYGRDYADIAPLKGVVFSSGNSQLSVMVDVRKEQMQEQTQSQSFFGFKNQTQTQ
ncbi:MAG: transglutaminase family protein [Sulfurimonas sp.]|jgi:transglutaminase-like putative cysteine protease|nr:transglutaminase family protein [Sulfurimonas sp.]MBU1217505.1 transglutaminase family protein [bacterium]MBU1433771.1 transglutaminase family protein [bacterium]MBU1503846.1 transglutaminase family protein [bacterium]MBU3939108.1 transglutaminase family protein [bacterium]